MDIIEKRKLAHEYALGMIQVNGMQINQETAILVKYSWKYADAMEAAENERKAKGLPDALRDGA